MLNLVRSLSALLVAFLAVAPSAFLPSLGVLQAQVLDDFGKPLSPEEGRRLKAKIERLERTSRLQAATIEGIARRLNLNYPGLSERRLFARLDEEVEGAVLLRRDLVRLQGELTDLKDPAKREPALRLSADAQKAFDSGDFEKAELLLSQLSTQYLATLETSNAAWLRSVRSQARAASLQGDPSDFDRASDAQANALLMLKRQRAQAAIAQYFLALDLASTHRRKGASWRDPNAFRAAIQVYESEVLEAARMVPGVPESKIAATYKLIAETYESAFLYTRDPSFLRDAIGAWKEVYPATLAIFARPDFDGHDVQKFVAPELYKSWVAQIENGLKLLEFANDSTGLKASLSSPPAIFVEICAQKRLLECAEDKAFYGNALWQVGLATDDRKKQEQAQHILAEALASALRVPAAQRFPGGSKGTSSTDILYAKLFRLVAVALLDDPKLGLAEKPLSEIVAKLETSQSFLRPRTAELDWINTTSHLARARHLLAQTTSDCVPLNAAIADLSLMIERFPSSLLGEWDLGEAGQQILQASAQRDEMLLSARKMNCDTALE